MPTRGMRVDFGASDGWAMAIYAVDDANLARPTANTSAGPKQKSKVAAGVLAILLGEFGIHKFYLGYSGAGAVMLIGTIIGLITAVLIVGFFLVVAIAIIALIEGILYLTKSDEDFNTTYVLNRKSWF